VDDTEDQEVVWHELGHAIQDSQVHNYGTSLQAGSIGEGFGDYWAVMMSEPVSDGFDLPCVMDWDATSYTSGSSPCLRRIDTPKTTDDLAGQVHADGEIRSGALWGIHLGAGPHQGRQGDHRVALRVLARHSFAKAARHVVSTARVMYGDAAATKVRTTFRGSEDPG
jgi:Zn-dependent metalloprotease